VNGVELITPASLVKGEHLRITDTFLSKGNTIGATYILGLTFNEIGNTWR
jgi:hypothetical protein